MLVADGHPRPGLEDAGHSTGQCALPTSQWLIEGKGLFSCVTDLRTRKTTCDVEYVTTERYVCDHWESPNTNLVPDGPME